MPRALVLLAVSLASAIAASGCTLAAPPAQSPGTSVVSPAASSPDTAGSITIYSGRSEELVGPLIERFETESGIEAEVRYGDTAELAGLLLEEGANTPADVFFAQDAGALGAVSAADLLTRLPGEILDRVPEELRSPEGEWVGISGRARVVVYDSRDVPAADLPAAIDGFTDPQWQGRIGWAPTNGSFQAFVTAYRELKGEDAARAWLEGIKANEPRRFDSNSAIVEAVAAGEIDVGFVNHYYLLQAMSEQGDDFPVRNHFLSGEDPGALINVAGAGILAPSDSQAAARSLIDFLLSEGAQRYFAEETFEYPLASGVAPPTSVPPLESIQAPDIDLSNLADLQGTLDLLREVGVLE